MIIHLRLLLLIQTTTLGAQGGVGSGSLESVDQEIIQ
jgi:hypothetical protein